jgi:F-type H+-transporting ATPase subunit alpha
VLWAVQNGFLDDVPVPRVKEFQTRLTEFLTASKTDLLALIVREKALNDASTAGLKDALEQFKKSWS